MKRLNDFYLINNKVEYEEFEKDLDGRFGVQRPTIRNKPTKFPVVLSYCFTSDVNGYSVNLKHSQLDDFSRFLND